MTTTKRDISNSKIRIKENHDSEDVVEVLLGIRKILTVRDGKEPTDRYILDFCGLTDREIKVYYARLFYNRTFKSIGLEIGTCPNNASAILSKSLRKIRGFWARNYEWDIKEEKRVNKEEKLEALFNEAVEEYKAVSGEQPLNMEEYKDDVWKNLRIECAQKEDVEDSCKWLFGVIANYIRERFHDQGVYDVLLCISRKGDFDSSEEAQDRRRMLKDAQQALQDKLKSGAEAIEAEYS